MLATVVLAAAMAGAVASLLHAIRVEDRALEVISKGAASAAFVILGVLRWQPGDLFGGWLAAGLVLCALGDLCLLWERSFEPGLLSFVLGHLAYIVGFSAALPMTEWPLPVAVPMAAAALAVGAWLWPRLGRRRPAVAAYIAAISVMVWGGVSTSWSLALPWTAGAGAVLFYLSDVAVARQRFVHPEYFNRAVGLPAYYAGQLLLALTISGS